MLTKCGLLMLWAVVLAVAAGLLAAADESGAVAGGGEMGGIEQAVEGVHGVAGHEVGGHEAVAAHEEPGLLSVDYGSAVWTIVLFVVLMGVLGKFVWPQILKGLKGREEKIRDDLQRAESAAKQAMGTLREYELKLAQAQDETRRMMEQARGDAQKLSAQLKHEAEVEINQLRVRAEGDIRGAKEQALNEVYAAAGGLATDVASRILRRQISVEDQQRLVEESLRELAQRRD
jgi:F-type H+-transporting ATPase subunit b